jgi:phosphoribosylglycinamide formyltransferase 1
VNGRPYTIAVFASGSGSNLQVIIDQQRTGELPVRLAFVLSNNSKAFALERARRAEIPAFHVSAKTEGGEEASTAKQVGLLRDHQVDLLVLAGYMKKVPEAVLQAMPNRVLNIHPALLPAFGGEGFYGHKVHEGVVARGCQITGMTIHMVNSHYDEGQIVLQKAVRVDPQWNADEVGAAVLKLEHDNFWRVIHGFAAGQIQPSDSAQPSQAVIISPKWLAVQSQRT